MTTTNLEGVTPNLERAYLRPVLFLALGGFGCQVAWALRCYLLQRFGFLPECFRFLAIDFATDQPRPGTVPFAAEIPPEAWTATQLTASESAWIDTDIDVALLAARIEAGEPDVSWLRELIDPAVLAAHPGGEAAQVPALARAYLAYWARGGGGTRETPWVQKLENHLTELVPQGKALHALLERGVPDHLINRSPATIVAITGGSGGSGNGFMMASAIVARWLCRRLGLWAHVHAHVVAGRYRGHDGQEARKQALAHTLMMDIEDAADSDVCFELPLGPDERATWQGRLFDSCSVFESEDRLAHDEHGAIAANARQLLFSYATLAGWQMAKSRTNIDFTPRLRAIAGLR